MNTTRRLLACATVVLAIACEGGEVDVTDTAADPQLPPPAAAVSGSPAEVGLQSRLANLEADLATVLAGDLSEESQQYLLRAEAITDRLLEDEPEFTWLGGGYLVEARLRQIQALADRIVSELRRGVAREFVLEDVAALRHAVADLRTRLAEPGNGTAPPPLDSLLAGYQADLPVFRSSTATGDSTVAPAAPAAAPSGGGDAPLGEPIRP